MVRPLMTLGLNLLQIRDIIREKKRQSDADGVDVLPYTAVDEILGQAVGSWEVICLEHFTAVLDIINGFLEREINAHFSGYRDFGLLNAVR